MSAAIAEPFLPSPGLSVPVKISGAHSAVSLKIIRPTQWREEGADGPGRRRDVPPAPGGTQGGIRGVSVASWGWGYPLGFGVIPGDLGLWCWQWGFCASGGFGGCVGVFWGIGEGEGGSAVSEVCPQRGDTEGTPDRRGHPVWDVRDKGTQPGPCCPQRRQRKGKRLTQHRHTTKAFCALSLCVPCPLPAAPSTQTAPEF